MNEIIFKGIWAVIILIMLIYYGKRKHTVKSAFMGMFSGGTVLLLLHYFGGEFGFSPPVNLFNTIVSVVLGIPGTALIMAVNMISF